ncbi:hypothetical protein [Haladaptatus sp. CMAA 1911]|uniref:hypothetical protein n=1 Tax=unclassified Haladaptatus TaxID=2622732 RepID=UPI003754A225
MSQVGSHVVKEADGYHSYIPVHIDEYRLRRNDYAAIEWSNGKESGSEISDKRSSPEVERPGRSSLDWVEESRTVAPLRIHEVRATPRRDGRLIRIPIPRALEPVS